MSLKFCDEARKSYRHQHPYNMENIDNVKGFIRALDSSVDELLLALKPALSVSLEETIAKCNLPQEKIKVYHSYLYCLISILYAYLKSLGVNTDEHPIMKELTRIKESMKKLKDFEESLKNKKEDSAKNSHDAKEFLQRTLGTTGGAATPDSMKVPAISSASFQGTHTKFTEHPDSDEDKPKKTVPNKKSAVKTNTSTKSKPSGKVSKPKKAKKVSK